MTEPEIVRLPMVCVHGDEGGTAADALREKVKGLLSVDDYTCTDADFVTRVVGCLYWEWNADVAFVCDQWFGVYATVEELVPPAKRVKDAPKLRATLRLSCECDRVEDGLAAIYEWFHEHRPISDDA